MNSRLNSGCVTGVGCMRRRLGTVSACVMAMLTVFPAARAQYAYSPTNPDELAHHVRYFGSAKDEKGRLLPGALILLYTSGGSFTFVTDEQGRFSSDLPFNTLPENATLKCAKAGFEPVRLSQRPGPPSAPRPTMQVDCVFRQKSG
jgi:hypothetical protein